MKRTIPLVAIVGASCLGAQQDRPWFDASIIHLGVTDVPYTALLDFDGDGDLDAVGHWELRVVQGQVDDHHFRFALYRNDGVGDLSEQAWLEEIVYQGADFTDPLRTPIVTGDLNGDVYDDFAVGYDGLVRIYAGDPVQGAVLEQVIAGENLVRDMALADVDGDDQNELVLLTDTGLRLFERDGGTWSLEAEAPLFGSALDSHLRVMEATGDGVDDLAVVSQIFIHLFAYDTGTGFSQTYQKLHTALATHPAADDVTGNGLDDLVLFTDSGYHTLRQTSPGSFTLDPLAPGGPATGLADVDGDGDPDGICCGGGGAPPIGPRLDFYSNFEISINQGGGVFADAFQIEGLGARQIAGAADVSGDGHVDLVAGRVVYYGHDIVGSNVTSLGLEVVDPRRIHDLEGDGDPDLEIGLDAVELMAGVPLPASLPLSWLANLGDGAVETRSSNVPQAPPGTLFVGQTGLDQTETGGGFAGDWTGDGITDLVVEHWDEVTGFRAMRLWKGDGGGGFVDAGDASAPGEKWLPATSSGSHSYAIAHDIDGDLDLDALVVDTFFAERGTTFWMNDGAGFFEKGLDLSALVGSEYVFEIADFTSDGIDDLLLMSVSFPPEPTDGMLLRQGLGGGDFGPSYRPLPDDPNLFKSSLSLDPLIDRVAVGDWDEDGYVDIIARDPDPAVVSFNLWFLRNRGAADPGVFDAVPMHMGWPLGDTFHYHFLPHTVDAVDGDGDGRMDIVVQPIGLTVEGFPLQTDPLIPGSLVFHNTGSDPSLWEHSTQMFDADAFVDIDGDGDRDAIKDTVTRNGSHAGPDAGSRAQYGSGYPGAGGIEPVLGATGPFRVGENPTVRVRGAVGGALVLLGVASAPANIPGLPGPGATLLIDPIQPPAASLPVVANGVPGMPGDGAVDLTFVVNPGMVGLEVYAQAGALDPMSPIAFSVTNALALTFGG